MLQIELIGYTRVRAHDLQRTESSTWTLMSRANMNMPLGNPVEKSRREWKLPSRLWEDIPVPNTVCPSFETCNISRRYELEVRVGLAHGMADGVRPELIVLPLRLPVSVFSGIAPPPQLLRAMANNPRARAPFAPPQLFPRPSVSSGPSAAPLQSETPLDTPTTPMSEITSFPAQVGSFSTQDQPDIPDEAPPSYEDAIADEIAPVDGPRRDYQVPSEPDSQQNAFNPNSKRAGVGRRVSERLFPNNALSTPPTRTVSTPNVLQAAPITENGDNGPQSSLTTDEAPRTPLWRRSFPTKKD